MGRVMVAAKIENVADLYMMQKGLSKPDDVHMVEVSDALADTGATNLSMSGSLIRQRSLIPLRSRYARTTVGDVPAQVFGAARVTVQGRECTIDVTEVPETCPVLIGHVPLEMLDLVVDHGGQRLIGNPAHGGEPMCELY
jgi:predicted aspartyl protease